MRAFFTMASMLLLLVACTEEVPPVPPADAGPREDAGETPFDAGSDPDAGASMDAGSDAGVLADAGPADPDAGTRDCAVGDALFVGNSYTGSHNLAALTAGFATAAGCVVRYEAIAPGGARFVTHAGNAGTLDRIRTGGWDAVILQNQSQVPGFRPADVRTMSLPHAITLAATAREADPDPRLVYFVTWGRRDGDADNCGYYPLVCTFEGHTQALAEGYAMYATETMGELSPAGAAWALVRADAARPFDETALWSGDGSHPSLRGSYLTAAVMHYVLQGESPVGSSFDGGLDPSEAAYLQGMAVRAVDAL